MRRKEEAFCYIIGAGEFSGLQRKPKEQDLVIAADGGYAYLEKEGISANVLLGDFDSLGYIPKHDHLITHSPIKDETDMELAVQYGIEQGYHRFLLYGGTGGRMDHTMGNYQLLNELSQSGNEAYLIGSGRIVTAITNEQICFPESCSGMISVFSLTDVSSGITETGLKYCVSGISMTNRKALGVSNEFIGRDSSLEVIKGTLLIMWDRSNGLPAKRRRLTYE